MRILGLILMSERELHRIEVLSEVVEGRRTLASAAIVLSLSLRQVQRILRTFCLEGAASSQPRPTIEQKLSEQGFSVSRETLRKWMAKDGLWLSRKQRRTFRQPRLRRECYSELIQIDGSDHRWFEERGDPCTLLVFIGDATGRLMQLLFVRSESAFSYFEALALYLKTHGRPLAFYSDKHSVFRVAKKIVVDQGPSGPAPCTEGEDQQRGHRLSKTRTQTVAAQQLGRGTKGAHTTGAGCHRSIHCRRAELRY